MAEKTKEKHSPGLYVLFLTEMWERFSYYGMRALLTLYCVDQVAGLGWEDSRATELYGTYTAGVYITPLLGGILADRFLGFRRAVLIGGILMMFGHLSLAFEPLPFFYSGLFLLVFGNGFFKPNISSMVGRLYPEGSSLKDSAYTIFYMGINVGAFLGSIICGYLGEKVGWHYGFGAAGVGMGLGLIFYWWGAKKYLGDIGLRPDHKVEKEMAQAENREREKKKLTKVEIDRIIVILILAFFSIVFWMAFEQAGTSMNIFAYRYTDRNFFGFEIPATWFQSVNALFIVAFAPVFSALWNFLHRKNLNPAGPFKFGFGLSLLGIGFLVLGVGAGVVNISGSEQEMVKASMIWLVLAYLLHTWGELCLSPVGLSMVSKLSPKHLIAMFFGVWFLASAAGNLVGGYVGGFIETFREEYSITLFFYMIGGVAIGAGLLMFALAPFVRKLMHGVEQDPDIVMDDVER